MNKLLILADDATDYVLQIRKQRLVDLDIHACSRVEDTKDAIHDCNLMLASPTMAASVIQDAQRLVWLQSTFAGVDALCASGLRRDYVLTGVKGVFGPLISEYVFMYILALERHVLETRANQENKIWREIPYRSLKDITLGVCGLGSIGKHIAKTGAHFQMHVLGFNRTAAKFAHVAHVYSGVLTEFARELDYLVIALPGTVETQHMFDRSVFQAMQPSSVLINVGRGSVIVEGDLIEALQQRLLRAAVLDVFEHEPLPPDSPLWSLPNCFVTPHNAAVSFPAAITEIFADNYRRFLARRSLLNVVDFERSY